MSDESPSIATGCALLFVPILVVIDMLGLAAGTAGKYAPVVFAAAFAGLVIGMALGGYAYVKSKPPRRYTLGFWLALGGLIGMSLPALVTVLILQGCAP